MCFFSQSCRMYSEKLLEAGSFHCYATFIQAIQRVCHLPVRLNSLLDENVVGVNFKGCDSDFS